MSKVDYKNINALCKYTPDLRELSSELQQKGILYFSFVKRFNDNSRVNLSTIPNWFNEYYSEKLYIDSVFEKDPATYNQEFLICLQNDSLKVSEYATTRYNCGHGIAMINKVHDGIEFYFYSSSMDNKNDFLNFCINNKEDLQNFSLVFKDKGSKLLSAAEKLRFNFPSAHQIALSRDLKDDITYENHISINTDPADNFIPTKILMPNKLTERELSIVYLLSNGMTSKEIGKKLLISYRTVEKHLENIKIKLNCKNKAELLYKSSEQYFRKN